MAENQETNPQTKPKEGVLAKTSLLDHNASWPLMLVYLGYLIGIYFAQRATFTAGVPFPAEYHEKLRSAESEPGVKAIFSVWA